MNSERNQAPSLSSPQRLPLWKRCLDLTCIFFALPFLAPLFLAIAACIKIVSRGPILFCQPRIGHRGRPFTCFKFRSMRTGADKKIHENHFKQLMQSQQPMTKLDVYGDERLIPLGALLRSSGLDELPQLVNVIRGEMSLVGPRPCTPNEYEDYLPWHKERFRATPGLTGLWQVSGKNETTFDEMIDLDIRYAKESSLGLDLKIMLKTVPVLFREVIRMLKHKARLKKATPEIVSHPMRERKPPQPSRLVTPAAHEQRVPSRPSLP